MSELAWLHSTLGSSLSPDYNQNWKFQISILLVRFRYIMFNIFQPEYVDDRQYLIECFYCPNSHFIRQARIDFSVTQRFRIDLFNLLSRNDSVLVMTVLSHDDKRLLENQSSMHTCQYVAVERMQKKVMYARLFYKLRRSAAAEDF